VNQNVSPKMFIGIVAAVVLIAVAVMWWVWRAPSAPVSHASPEEVRKAMATMQHGPNADELKQIQEWKKTHPGATTKY